MEPATGATRIVHALLAALAGAALLLALFVLLDRIAGGAFQVLDSAALAGLEARRTPGGMESAAFVTALGNTLTLAVLAAWALVGFWRAGVRAEVAVLVPLFVTGRLATEVLKALFARPRPELLDWGAYVTSAAFPSAHAMASTIVFGGLAWLLGRSGARRGVRSAGWAAAGVLVAAIGLSRVYLGVHYPTDILAGTAAGALWLVIGLRVARPARPRSDGA
jgi:undecaprenyl-diphosphatase